MAQAETMSDSLSSSGTASIPFYRAWHKKLKRMLSVKAIFYPTDAKPVGKVWLSGCRNGFRFEEVTLMTRANFATKNGPLYDGDIIRDDRSKPLYRVALRHDFGWEVFEVGGPPEYIDCILAEDGPLIEVIGNIYENPELLSIR